MKVEKNKVVSVNYHLTGKLDQEQEELIEQTSAEQPFVFLYGSGGVLEDFEKNLNGKQAGDAFDFHIKADKAYGEHNGDYVAEIPKERDDLFFRLEDRLGKVGARAYKFDQLEPLVNDISAQAKLHLKG